jgi:hypothetical protein
MITHAARMHARAHTHTRVELKIEKLICILFILLLQGFMEKTVLFYGYYSDKEIDFTSLTYNYNMPFAYVTSINVVFVVSLAIMVVL